MSTNKDLLKLPNFLTSWLLLILKLLTKAVTKATSSGGDKETTVFLVLNLTMTKWNVQDAMSVLEEALLAQIWLFAIES